MTPVDDNWTAGDAYEGYMGRWSRPLARRFVEWLDLRHGADWLEVGCGTGALTSAICELAEPASITACDPSDSFVAHARRALRDRRVSFVVAGSDALPGGPEAFDCVASGLVLNLVADPARAVGLMKDRLRRGGMLAAYVWDYRERHRVPARALGRSGRARRGRGRARRGTSLSDLRPGQLDRASRGRGPAEGHR